MSLDVHFEKEAFQAAYLANGGGEYSLRGQAEIIKRIDNQKYKAVVEKLKKSAMAVGQAPRAGTNRGDEWQVLYNGAVITIVNPEGESEMGRGIEIEAESRAGLEKVINLLDLPVK